MPNAVPRPYEAFSNERSTDVTAADEHEPQSTARVEQGEQPVARLDRLAGLDRAPSMKFRRVEPAGVTKREAANLW